MSTSKDKNHTHKIDFPSDLKDFKKILVLKKNQTRRRIKKKYPEVIDFLREKGVQIGQLRKHATKLLAGATVATALLTQPAVLSAIPGRALIDEAVTSVLPNLVHQNKKLQLSKELSSQLKILLPDSRGQLNPWEVGQISQLLNKQFGLSATSFLEDHHLNHQYGMIGFEQHLIRYPGDTVSQHDELQLVGMAPKQGAWGMFADSKNSMTDNDYLREKYYVAVQTLYLPEWNEQHKELKEWYKYRKVVVINPENGQGVIAVIADAGPANWTGKVFGGSPEVMQSLNLHEGSRKGKVVLLFVEDSEDKVNLGPLEY